MHKHRQLTFTSIACPLHINSLSFLYNVIVWMNIDVLLAYEADMCIKVNCQMILISTMKAKMLNKTSK